MRAELERAGGISPVHWFWAFVVAWVLHLALALSLVTFDESRRLALQFRRCRVDLIGVEKTVAPSVEDQCLHASTPV